MHDVMSRLVIDLVAMDERLVGVDYLFEVEGVINVMGERGVVVEVLVRLLRWYRCRPRCAPPP